MHASAAARGEAHQRAPESFKEQEHQAGDQPHMQARYRQQVAGAGVLQQLPLCRGDAAALADRQGAQHCALRGWHMEIAQTGGNPLAQAFGGRDRDVPQNPVGG
jgi:hypothetical protein